MNERPNPDNVHSEIPMEIGFGRQDPYAAAVPPIYQSSLFLFDSYAELENVFAGRSPKPIYSRGDNPTVRLLEQKIAEMEGAEEARAFSSGMGAIARPSSLSFTPATASSPSGMSIATPSASSKRC